MQLGGEGLREKSRSSFCGPAFQSSRPVIIFGIKKISPLSSTANAVAATIELSDGAPGNGSIVLETAKGKIGVINIQARTFMQPVLENPFRAVEAMVMKMREETTNIIVDAHGETTSEKIALGRFLDGKVSAVIGTHTHVQTADEQIFPGGTAFMCDAGMCGPINSILGRAIEPIMNRFVSNLPASFPVAGGEVRLRGALIEIDGTTGRAVRITRVDEPGPNESASSEPEPKIDIEQASSPEQT